MFRKMAIALVAASVFTAPVLAENDTLSGGSNTNKNPPSTATPQTDTTNKTDKSETTTTDKSAGNAGQAEKTGKHRRSAARHHRHGTSAKLMRGHHRSKYAKAEARRTGHGRGHAYGRGSRGMLKKHGGD